jgi:hypothetical protein
MLPARRNKVDTSVCDLQPPSFYRACPCLCIPLDAIILSPSLSEFTLISLIFHHAEVD